MPLRAVLVDDDERFRAMARRVLIADGLDVVAEVGRGAEVEAAVARWRPDMVLLDIGLPDVDGIEVARRLAADGGGPVVILISSRDVVYGRRVAHGVAAGYVPKDALSLAAVLEVFGPAPTAGDVRAGTDDTDAVREDDPGPLPCSFKEGSPTMTTFAPIAPTIAVPPLEIAKDTFVIHQVQEALGQPLFVYINSMVILGAEPMIVDTGTPANRQQWLSDVFSLVEPEAVRWVFLSHDDVDHTGNLEQVMDACPNAKLVCNWAMVERHTNCFNFPIDRCRWVMHEESFSIGDRTLQAVRPPVYDSPTTRGLFDPSTGVYWCVDSFATPLPDPKMAVADLDPNFWRFGMTLFSFGAVSPWLTMVDHDKFGRTVDAVQSLGAKTIAGCHTPVLQGSFIEQALETTRGFPSVEPPPLPNQSVLDQIIAATSQPVLG